MRVLHHSKPRSRTIVKGSPELLVALRLAMEFTQSQFARKIGVSRNTIARWERGEIIPPKMAELAAGWLYDRHLTNQ